MMANPGLYSVIRGFSGNGVGDVIPIANPTRAAQLQRQGYVVSADHPSLAANMKAPPPIDAGLLYGLAQMSVNELAAAIEDVDDVDVLRVAVAHDNRSGAKAALEERLLGMEE